jgi:hypothetical protein
MSIEELFSKRRQIRAAWDQKKLPSKEIIYDLLKRTLNIAPSKQNLFPFKIYAYGPDDLEKKKIVAQICSLWETGSVNHMDSENKGGIIKTAAGIIDVNDYVLDEDGNDMRMSPWVLVFTQRLCKPNNFVREHHELHQDGHRFTQTDPERFRGLCNTKLTCIEIGMYLQTLAGLCLENDLNISYIRTFPEWQWLGVKGEYKKESNKAGRLDWSSLPQITESPLMIAQIGHVANVVDYFKSNSIDPNDIHWENKPSIDEIIQFNWKE